MRSSKQSGHSLSTVDQKYSPIQYAVPQNRMTFGMFDTQQWKKARQSDVKYEGNINQWGMVMRS